jgi:hypothetical protein
MKTDELVAMLSTNIEPVDSRQVANKLRIAILSGLTLAFLIGVVVLGVRWDLPAQSALKFLLLKLAFGATIVILGSIFLNKYARPGGESHSWIAVAMVPFLALIALAGISLINAPASHWSQMMIGNQWLECLLSIPTIAVVPFAVIMWAVRFAAPTDLVRAGALAGLVAGGISAVAYALHCVDDSVPFVALWYGGTVLLCTVTGAALGPRLLRW